MFTAGTKVLWNRPVDLLPDQRETLQRALPVLLVSPPPREGPPVLLALPGEDAAGVLTPP